MNRDTEYFQILDKLRGSNDSRSIGHLIVPQLVMDTLRQLLEGQYANIVCDPWAGIGRIIAEVHESTQAKTAFAFTPYERDAILGKEFAKNSQWQVGNPLDFIKELPSDIDIIASCLPFGSKLNESLFITNASGEKIEVKGNLSDRIIVAASKKLNHNGIGIFVITPSFFYSLTSALKHFNSLDIGIEAAFALPPGTFAPYTGVSTYLAITRNHLVSKMFTAELSNDAKTNAQIISNFKQGKEGGRLELGRYVDPSTFQGLEPIRREEKFQQAERLFGVPAIQLSDITLGINMGRFGDSFSFPNLENVVFIPTIGITDVVNSSNDLKLKQQNYAQVVIDPTRSDARFVARFLNSEFGKEIRESHKTGSVIYKLNKKSIMKLEIFIPNLATQKEMISIEAQITEKQNILLGLQNELMDNRRELWSNPKSAAKVIGKLQVLSSRFSGSLKQHADESLEHWIDTLPFPLASILRAWQATPSDDFKSKYEHLLHFFEANAEFLSAILLSAFSSQESIFDLHREKLSQILASQKLSYKRATFGTWKITIEYLGKQTRALLDGDEESRNLCASMFVETKLAELLGRKELPGIINSTNKMRIDWLAHSGVVGKADSKLRNEQLIEQLQTLRNVTGDTWAEVQLLQALHCRPRHGVFENEVAILMGSNSEFLKETRSMSMWMDVELLYLAKENTGRALQLLPLVQVGPSPESTKNACYFFNRLENDGMRFVSYHFVDRPELKGSFEASGALKSLMEI